MQNFFRDFEVIWGHIWFCERKWNNTYPDIFWGFDRSFGKK